MVSGQIQGGGDGFSRGLPHRRTLRHMGNGRGRRSRRAMAEDAERAIPRVLVMVDGDERPAHQEEHGEQAGEPAECTRGAEHLD